MSSRYGAPDSQRELAANTNRESMRRVPIETALEDRVAFVDAYAELARTQPVQDLRDPPFRDLGRVERTPRCARIPARRRPGAHAPGLTCISHGGAGRV